MHEEKEHFPNIQKPVFTLFLLGLLLLPVTSAGQSIFSDLPYDEGFIRQKIEQYSISNHSTQSVFRIPENIYYKMLFQEILADSNLLTKLPEQDIAIVRNLPAHEQHIFIVNNHDKLREVCNQVANLTKNPQQILSAATNFDNARQASENELDAHYVLAVAKLTDSTQILISNLLQEFYASKNVTHSTYDMSGLAADVPDIAKSMLVNGCNNFAAQISNYSAQHTTLQDQLYSLSPSIP